MSQTSEEEYRDIFEAVCDGLIIHDLESGLIVEANPAAWLMQGYTREEFIGLQLNLCIHPDSRFAFGESIQVFQSGGLFYFQERDIRRDGLTFYAVWRGTAFTYQGRSLCWLLHSSVRFLGF
jgi:PAS domain S-box-containing protein